MKRLFVAALSLTACAIEPAEPDVLELKVGQCDDWMCGTNSPLIGGFGFHELNLDHAPNAEGFVLGFMVQNSKTYNVAVTGAHLTGVALDGSPDIAEEELIGAQIGIFYGGHRYVMRVDGLDYATHYWANIDALFESYELNWNDPSAPVSPAALPVWTPVCPHTDTTDLDDYYATLFAGERIDPVSKTILPTLEPRWFNVGCAGSTLAKLQLTARTQAAQDETQQITTTIDERQAMVKMLSADYCGDGTPYTVAGQRLDWQDVQGTLTYRDPHVALEAAWTARGASCVNTPRVEADPSPLAASTFMNVDVTAIVRHKCGIPACPTTPTHYMLLSANPPPLLGKLTP